MTDLVQGDTRITLKDLGEGWQGCYNENDPLDEPLLRFTVYVSGELLKRYQKHAPHDVGDAVDGWAPLSASSYCTQLSAEMPEHLKQIAAELLMSEVYKAVESMNFKSNCEHASHLASHEVVEVFARRKGQAAC